MNKLVEAYKQRLTVANEAYAAEHNGKNLSESKQVLVATMLNNVNKRMNEALGFSNSLAVQRSDMGAWKKFCLALTTVAVPNLIASDIVLTHPMTSIHGYVAYVKYAYGQSKGDVKAGEVIRTPFGFKNVDNTYTGNATAGTFETDAEGFVQLDWFPVVEAHIVGGESGAEVLLEGEGVDAAKGKVKVVGASGSVRIAYKYDNEIIPQKKLPTLTASMDGMELHAKARRIAVMYSTMAAYEAKQDYGFDLPEQLSTQAVAELSYEIDSEVVSLLAENAKESEELKFNITLPTGVNLRDHYATFSQTIAKAKKIVYKRTQKCVPNYMVCDPEVKVILEGIESFKDSGIEKMAGPYFAGTLGGLKVYVHPEMEEFTFFLGVNSADMATSAAVFAPYMPIIPSSLTDLPDGSAIQGWATMYDLKILNKDLLVKGRIVEEPRIVEVHSN
jgi:hypothetical protein